MMPAMDFRRDEQIVQKATPHIAAAMRKSCDDIGCGDRNKNGQRLKADDAQHKEHHDIPKSEINRVGNLGVGGLQIRHPVMIGMKRPQKLVVMLPTMHPVAEQADRQQDHNDLQPQWAQLFW
jgi:hypothetical protein